MDEAGDLDREEVARLLHELANHLAAAAVAAHLLRDPRELDEGHLDSAQRSLQAAIRDAQASVRRLRLHVNRSRSS